MIPSFILARASHLLYPKKQKSPILCLLSLGPTHKSVILVSSTISSSREDLVFITHPGGLGKKSGRTEGWEIPYHRRKQECPSSKQPMQGNQPLNNTFTKVWMLDSYYFSLFLWKLVFYFSWDLYFNPPSYISSFPSYSWKQLNLVGDDDHKSCEFKKPQRYHCPCSEIPKYLILKGQTQTVQQIYNKSTTCSG